MQINQVCSHRSRKLTMKGRQKSIVRTRTTKLVEVHIISLGKSMFINPFIDMVMVHFKLKFKQNAPTPIYQNQFVQHALNRELF